MVVVGWSSGGGAIGNALVARQGFTVVVVSFFFFPAVDCSHPARKTGLMLYMWVIELGTSSFFTSKDFVSLLPPAER